MLSDSENQDIFVNVSNCQFQHFRCLSSLKLDLLVSVGDGVVLLMWHTP